MKNRLISITQTLLVLLIISLIYQFDKVKSANSKSQLDTIRMLVKFTDSYEDVGTHSSKMDEAIRKWLVQNDEETYELNLKAREVVSQALNEVGVDSTEISRAKDLSPMGGKASFVTSRIASNVSRSESKYKSGDLGRAIEDYHLLIKKRPVSVLSSVDPNKLSQEIQSRVKPKEEDPFRQEFGIDRDEVINENNKFDFLGCYIKKDAIVISHREPQDQRFQRSLQRNTFNVEANTKVVAELSYFDLLPKPNLTLLSETELSALEKYDDQLLEEVEAVLVDEYLHAFGKVEILGFQLSNQSFSTVILLLLFIISGVLLLSLKQSKLEIETSDSESMFSVFLEIAWLRKLTWIGVPLIINGIALYNSYALNLFWGFMCLCALITMYFMIRSSSKIISKQ